MNKSDSIVALAGAMAQAQGEIENASKNSNNPHFKSKYADLAEVLNTVRPVFAKHGLSIAQWPGFNEGMATLETILMHKSGEWISSIAMTPLSKQDAQGVGSALTYLRRYSLAAIAGIAQEDDDGNAATKRDDKQDDLYGRFESQWLQKLRDASLLGKAALAEAFELLPKGEFKTKLWIQHGNKLKEAADLSEGRDA